MGKTGVQLQLEKFHSVRNSLGPSFCLGSSFKLDNGSGI